MSGEMKALGCFCAFAVMIAIIVLISSSFVYVPLEHWGLKVNSISKEIDPTPLESGSYGNSLGMEIYKFPRSLETINFMADYSDSTSEDKVLRLTGSDSASILLQISFSYTLIPEALAELYKTHGFNWKASIKSNARSLLRDAGSKYAALDYVKDGYRVTIEADFKEVMKNYFEKTLVKDVPSATLVGFYLLAVDFEKSSNGQDKDDDILRTIKVKKDEEKIVENSKLQVIEEITGTNISKLSQERLSFVAVQTQQNLNTRKQKETVVVDINAATQTLVTGISAVSQANATNYRSQTSNLQAVQSAAVVTYGQDTLKMVNAIKSEIKVLEAAHEQAKREISAEASKIAAIKISNAQQQAYLNRTKVIETAYKNLQTGLGLSGEELNTLKFIKTVELHNEDHLFMDIQKPDALNLDGQNAKYLESLKSGYTRL